MAAITTGVIGAVGAVGSAAASNRAARAQERGQRAAQETAREAALRRFGFSNSSGSGSFDPATGRLTTSLGDRLQGQQGTLDNFASLFGGQIGQEFAPGAQDTLALRQLVAGNQPGVNNNFFDSLGSAVGDNLGLAQGGIFDALNFQQQANAGSNQLFGQAAGFLSNIGTGEQARDDALGLLRQQAQPFEQRAFSGLQDNLFSTGRLGTSGGALQTEAFARGLGQVDLDRQLQAIQEGRNTQNQNLGLGSSLFGLGSQARSLGDGLVNSAFSRFGNFANLGQDVQNAQFGQNLQSQQNLFNQLGSVLNNQIGLAGAQQGFNQQNFQNVLSAFGAGNQLDQIPLQFLNAAAQSEQARSSSLLGGAGIQGGLQFGQQNDVLAGLFSGLGQSAQGGGFQNFLSGLGSFFNNSQAPTTQPGAPI